MAQQAMAQQITVTGNKISVTNDAWENLQVARAAAQGVTVKLADAAAITDPVAKAVIDNLILIIHKLSAEIDEMRFRKV